MTFKEKKIISLRTGLLGNEGGKPSVKLYNYTVAELDSSFQSFAFLSISMTRKMNFTSAYKDTLEIKHNQGRSISLAC